MWIYTSSFRSERYLKLLFDAYGIHLIVYLERDEAEKTEI